MFKSRFTSSKYLSLFLILFASVFNQAFSQCNCDFTINPGSASITFDGKSSGVKPGDVICIMGGARERITFSNIIGTASSYVTIKNCSGEARLGSLTASNPIVLSSSRYVRLTGSGHAGTKYGIKIVGSKSGDQGVAVVGFSSDIEIDHLEISRVGFAGIMAKVDPSKNCADKSGERPNYTMSNMRIHDCYFHDIGGEGIYLGNSFYGGTTVYCGSTQYPHEVRGAKIHNNLFETTGWESIQVGSAVSDVEIYNNRIYNYGNANVAGQNGGIQMGLGTTGKLYNNFIKGGKGTALVIQGIGNNYVYNNVIVNPGAEAINVNTRPTPLTTDIVSKGFLGGVYIINNTIVGASVAGITEYINDAPGNVLYNNLVVASASAWDQTKFYYDWKKGNNIFVPLISNAGFVDPSSDDYRLKSNSPAVNAGMDVLNYKVTIDMDNLVRPRGGVWDAGAHEFGGTGNLNPVVTVNAVQTLSLPATTITLVGSASDADGSVTSYLWTKVSGPAGVSLTNATTTSLKLSGLIEGKYVFRLTAGDNAGGKGLAEITLTVQSVVTNQPPKANAGTDKTITLPTNATTLSGSGTDADGSIVAYKWTQRSGPGTAKFTSTTQAKPTISGLIAGSYVFGLVVTDNHAKASVEDKVVVTVAAVTQRVVSFSVINADNEQVIMTLSNGATLNLAELPTRRINFRANTNPSKVGSVKFALSGTRSRNTSETEPPYALYGDSKGDYKAWVPVVGSYALKGTPYSSSSGRGTAGAALTISFSVVDKAGGLASARVASPGSSPDMLMDGGESETRVTAFPNPFHESLKLSILSDSSVEYRIRYYDNAGRLLMHDVFTPASPHADTYTLDVPKHSSGMHVIIVDSKANRYRKVIKVLKKD